MGVWSPTLQRAGIGLLGAESLVLGLWGAEGRTTLIGTPYIPPFSPLQPNGPHIRTLERK